MKKLLSLLVVMTISANLWAVEAVIDGIKYDVIKVGKKATVLYNSYSGEVIIPETIVYDGVECKVTGIGNGAFEASKATYVYLPDNVTEIGSYAFRQSSKLVKVRLGNNIQVIGYEVFSNCGKLEEINLPEGLTEIGKSAFRYCNGLTSLDMPNSLQTIGDYAFNSCLGLTTLNFLEGMRTIGSYAFGGCTNLSTVTFENGVTTLGNNVFAATGLKKVKIPNTVTTMGTYVFASCSELFAAEIGSGMTTVPNHTFDNCTALMSVRLREGITEICNKAFYACSDLEVILLPNSVTTIGESAFQNCSKLYNVGIREGCELIDDYAFQNCSALEFITIPNSVKTIEYHAFYNCGKLGTVRIGSGITSIGSYAFSKCEELANVYCEATAVPEADYAFNGGTYIEYATLHVPAASVAAYRTTAPWSGFGTIETIDGTPEPEPPVLEKCATPTISYADNMVTFSCATEGVNFVYDIKVSGATGVSSQVALRPTYSISVYATKSGYEDSDTATETITPTNNLKGDVDGDGEVDIADAVRIVNFVVGKIPALAPRNENTIPNPE